MDDLFKAKNRFDLEQEILDCWNITKDIKHVLDMFDREGFNEDKVMNALIGLEVLYEQKFNTLFDTFETCVHSRQI